LEKLKKKPNFQKRVQKFAKALEVKGQAMAAWQWVEMIAEGLGLAWRPMGPEELLREGFGMGYGELGAEGKIISK
jgi:predicted molibdopterin-dependent oxidoreductase YjgC